jgi:hypothetical protein
MLTNENLKDIIVAVERDRLVDTARLEEKLDRILYLLEYTKGPNDVNPYDVSKPINPPRRK